MSKVQEDIQGNKICIGDTVGYITGYQSINTGTVEAFTPKRVRLKGGIIKEGRCLIKAYKQENI